MQRLTYQNDIKVKASWSNERGEEDNEEARQGVSVKKRGKSRTKLSEILCISSSWQPFHTFQRQTEWPGWLG